MALEEGFRGPQVCKIAGITYRQLDYWARTGLVEPGIRGATGSGSQRLYGFRDILVLKVVKRLLDTGLIEPAPAPQHYRVTADGWEFLQALRARVGGSSGLDWTRVDEIDFSKL